MACETAQRWQSAPGLRALERWLRDQAIGYQVIRHEPTFEASDAARAARIPAEQTAKTLVLRDGDEVVVAAVPACERLDLRKLRAALGRPRSLRLAEDAEIAARFPRFEIGAIPPLGPVPVDTSVVDGRLLTYNRVLCSGGDHCYGVLLDAMDLVRAGHAVVADVCEDRPRRSA
jgi:prolyl-tRNA editing enzyme YbaK/EbsC (Cys-tRNA(Pro) deacylase)